MTKNKLTEKQFQITKQYMKNNAYCATLKDTDRSFYSSTRFMIRETSTSRDQAPTITFSFRSCNWSHLPATAASV